MSSAPTLRALEPADAAALHAVFTDPEVATDLPEHDPSQSVTVFRELLQAVDPSRQMWVGAWLGDELVGAAHLAVGTAPRRRHVGQAQLGVLARGRQAGVGHDLLAALVDAASRWYHLDRVEMLIPALAEPKLTLVQQRGFAEEARKRKALLRDGERVDLALMTWVRPGLTTAPLVPELPARPGQRLAVTVRTARPDDAPAIAAMQGTESVRWGTMQLPYTSAQFWRKRLETNDPAQHHLRIAEHQGRVVGLTGLHGEGLLRTAHAWSFGMSVHPDAQGCGVGTALMRDILTIADQWLGATRIELEVYADNERALRLYRAHGFEPEGTKRFDTWRGQGYVDALVMSRVR